MHIDDYRTKITSDHMAQARAIPIQNIDYGEDTQSRVRGGSFDKDGTDNSHLQSVSQSIKNRLDDGRPALDVPIVVDDKMRLVLGHHRLRGFLQNGLESIDALAGVTFSDERTRRRFRLYNNDHDTPAETNSKYDLRCEVDETIRDLIDNQNYDINNDRREIRLQTRAEMKSIFGNTWSPSQIALMVDKWFENEIKSIPNVVTKFKAYTPEDAFAATKIIMDMQHLKEPGKPQQGTNDVIYCANLDDGGPSRYWGYAQTLLDKLAGEGKSTPKITLALYFRAGKLIDYRSLRAKRREAESKFLALRKGAKSRLKRGAQDPVHELIWLPQHMGEHNTEAEHGKVPGPW